MLLIVLSIINIINLKKIFGPSLYIRHVSED